MPEAKGWLSLRVSNKTESERHSFKSSLLISIPKKIVHLATRRNRIKRLLREVYRKEDLFEPGKIYEFRVIRQPEYLDLKEVKKSVIFLVK